MSKKNTPNHKKACKICLRGTDVIRFLGPLMSIGTISAHFYCVVSAKKLCECMTTWLMTNIIFSLQAFSPVKADKVSISSDGIGGMSQRFIREEAKRAKPLVSIANVFEPFTPYCLCFYIN